jgi:hydroxyethylthiazole kinase-like uncharacterized protein yjeF
MSPRVMTKGHMPVYGGSPIPRQPVPIMPPVRNELLTTAEMGECDRLTITSGTPGIVLMENAGRAVADAVARRDPPGSRVVVVAGPGNNGGDGFVAARLLAERRYRVTLLLVGSPEKLKGDAAEAARRWTGPVVPAAPEHLDGAHVVIDALFGAGLARPVDGLAMQMIEATNAAAARGATVVAVDLPSGINGTTGAVMGVAVQAAESVTFFRGKPGHWLLPGRLHCGRLTIADIGIPDAVLETVRPGCVLVGPAMVRATLPVPSLQGHKYSRGHAVVVSGSASTTGAARLAARAALRAGAGLVTLASPSDALAVNAMTNLAVMVRPVDGAAALAAFLDDRRFNAVALGPGLGVGPATRELVAAALAGQRSVVLDADALTSFAAAPEELFAAVRGRGGAATIMTPHEGEFSRLFGHLSEIHQASSKLERTTLAARRAGAVVLLKGGDTVIADLDGRAAINANAPAHLATAGAGDVLTGIVTGLCAQGVGAFEAAAAAAWLHGEAANAVGPGLIAEDLSEVMPSVYARLFDPLAALGAAGVKGAR